MFRPLLDVLDSADFHQVGHLDALYLELNANAEKCHYGEGQRVQYARLLRDALPDCKLQQESCIYLTRFSCHRRRMELHHKELFSGSIEHERIIKFLVNGLVNFLQARSEITESSEWVIGLVSKNDIYVFARDKSV
jgi:hypothetical protein